MLEISRNMADVNRKQASTHCFFRCFLVMSDVYVWQASNFVFINDNNVSVTISSMSGCSFTPTIDVYTVQRPTGSGQRDPRETKYFYAVQFSSRWYLCARKSPHALHLVSQFSQRCPWNSSNVHQTDDGPFLSFKEDPLALLFSTPLSSTRSMVWCPWLCARR